MDMYVGLKFEAIVPEPSGCAHCKHLTSRAFLYFFDLPLSGTLPGRVWLSLLQLTVGIYKLMAKLAQGLLLQAVHHHRRWYALTLEHQGKGFVRFTFGLHRIHMYPSKVTCKHLCAFIIPVQICFRVHCIGEYQVM